MARDRFRLIPEDGPAEGGVLDSIAQLGLAFYALLVLSMMLAASLCAGLSLFGALSAAPSVSGLTTSSELEVWRLAQLRQWGVIPSDASPLLYHDHSPFYDSSAGCAVLGDELLRWDQQAVTARVKISGAEVRAEGEADHPTVIVTQGEGEVACPFGVDEGGDRFLRMLQTEARRGR